MDSELEFLYHPWRKNAISIYTPGRLLSLICQGFKLLFKSWCRELTLGPDSVQWIESGGTYRENTLSGLTAIPENTSPTLISYYLRMPLLKHGVSYKNRFKAC
ncbi:hypothetical protein GCM10007063_31020 [Lentibacillus kapialis]|uniref:Uncharacterized protein n=1 Tax=Lentibacillus kapialis TaxID=340214 RepID=A0A917Q1U3_9BACI|nr:hypothetical protein GCM10007063_31020 [Lentibacillus kapialis]